MTTTTIRINKYNTVAVVGGGASPVNNGWAWRIDKCDAVVRMFDHGWQDKQDYGEKITYSVFMINRGPAYGGGWPDRKVAKPSDEYWGILARSKYKKLVPEFEKREPFNFFDLAGLDEAGKDLVEDAPDKYTIARGVAAVLMAIIVINPQRIFLVGFDNIRQKKITQSAHKKEVQNLGKRFVGKWDPVTDKALIDNVAKIYNCQITHML